MIDWYAEQSDKFIGTTAAILGLIAAGTTAGASVYGAHEQSSAANNAAKLQIDAANHGADVQDAAAQRAEAFSRQQAENEWQNSQNVQQANYNQSKARYGSIAGVASQYGLNLGGMPDYQPGIDPHYTDAGTPAPGSVAAAGPSAGPSANITDPSAWMSLVGDTPKLTQWVQGNLGPNASPADVNYYVGKIKGQPGANPTEQAGGAAFWAGKMKAGSATATAKPGTIAAAAPYTAPTLTTPTINTSIPLAYQPGTIGAYGRMQ